MICMRLRRLKTFCVLIFYRLFMPKYLPYRKSGKEMTEEDEIRIIKKFIKNIDETLGLDIPDEQKTKYKAEKQILESYLPSQLSKDEIEKIVSEQFSRGKIMKDIMGYFKENYSGRYDGKTVSEIVRAKQGS